MYILLKWDRRFAGILQIIAKNKESPDISSPRKLITLGISVCAMGESANCDEKLRLLLEFQKATRTYSRQVAEMAKLAGAIPQVEYAVLSRAASKAHEVCLTARERFYNHVSEHDC
jgi:hypothetical protein